MKQYKGLLVEKKEFKNTKFTGLILSSLDRKQREKMYKILDKNNIQKNTHYEIVDRTHDYLTFVFDSNVSKDILDKVIYSIGYTFDLKYNK